MIGIVIVNWNGWSDTLESLESILRQRGLQCRIVICDNASSDHSLARFQAWSDGQLSVLPEGRHHAIRPLVVPSWAGPREVQVITEAQARAVGASANLEPQITFVAMEANKGFAGANNVGLQLLAADSRVRWFWLVNSDAVLAPDAWLGLDRAFAGVSGPKVSGSLLLEYWEPEKVQAAGADFNRFLGTVQPRSAGTLHRASDEEIGVGYPVGAAIAVNRAFVEQYGLMSEDYFLYYEEIDWVMRQAWPSRATVVTSSLVHHKGGKATNAGSRSRHRSLLSDYNLLRGRILLARRQKALLPRLGAIVSSLISLALRAARPVPGGLRNAWMAIGDGLRDRTGRKEGL